MSRTHLELIVEAAAEAKGEVEEGLHVQTIIVCKRILASLCQMLARTGILRTSH